MRSFRHGLVLALLLGASLTARVQADEAAVVAVIQDRAAAHGVSGARLVAVARCESTLNVNAVGDHGNSIGLFQINRNGLQRLFFAQGYDDLTSAYQQADFTAWAFSQGMAHHWSCA